MSFLDFGRRQLVSQEDAAMIAQSQIPRSRFNNQWSRKTTFDAAFLVPFLVDEILPGDHMTYDCTAYVRMATPVFPIFDSQRVDTFFFFVPNRILWDKWNQFMGEQIAPGQAISSLLVPLIGFGGGAGAQTPGSLSDHMGVPPNTSAAQLYVNALPFRAYVRIWNDWFRDQNLQDPLTVYTNDGIDPGNTPGYALQRRNKSHDYFTSALPWPQKFTAPNVAFTGTGQLPVLGIGSLQTGTGFTTSQVVNEVISSGVTYPDARIGSGLYAKMDSGVNLTAKPQIYAQLAGYANLTVNALRDAFMIQQLLEQDARGGSRYVEIIRSQFGVVSPDFRLNRPEYIGGGQTPLSVTPVAQTAPTTGAPVGSLGAAGVAVGAHRASYAATEHGWIIGLINVRSELTYHQGVHRQLTRRTRYEYYTPMLAALGEQAVLRKEIWATGDPLNDDLVFGYQERWHEYRTRYSEITGQFHSLRDTGSSGVLAGTLDAWHLGQHFNTVPQLNSAFLRDDPPMARVLAAGALAAGQQYLADIEIRRTAVRPIPTFGTPASLGRF